MPEKFRRSVQEKFEEFTGMANDSVDQGDYIVPKSEVGYDLWNRLLGVENPSRIPGA